MSIQRWIASVLGRGAQKGQAGDSGLLVQQPRALTAYIRCRKCGEIIALRIRKTDEVQRGEPGTSPAFIIQKVVVGNACFQRMPMRLELDTAYKLSKCEITGGELVAAEVYRAWLADKPNASDDGAS